MKTTEMFRYRKFYLRSEVSNFQTQLPILWKLLRKFKLFHRVSLKSLPHNFLALQIKRHNEIFCLLLLKDEHPTTDRISSRLNCEGTVKEICIRDGVGKPHLDCGERAIFKAVDFYILPCSSCIHFFLLFIFHP